VSAHAESGKPIVRASSREAVHFLGPVTVDVFGQRHHLKAIVCGRTVGAEPERFTDKPRSVTCDECRQHPAFAAAREAGKGGVR
jgi:hypothetical protein